MELHMEEWTYVKFNIRVSTMAVKRNEKEEK
jgi:hypothetical protein